MKLTPLKVTELVPLSKNGVNVLSRSWLFTGAKLGEIKETTILNEPLYKVDVAYRICIDRQLEPLKTISFNSLSPRNHTEARIEAFPIALRQFLAFWGGADVQSLRSMYLAIVSGDEHFLEETQRRFEEPNAALLWSGHFWCPNPTSVLKECAGVDLVLIDNQGVKAMGSDSDIELELAKLRFASATQEQGGAMTSEAREAENNDW